METKTKYLLMTDVVDVAVENGGTIFGGYVRDFIIHEHNAKKFYEEEENKPSDYADPSVSPHTYEGRTLVAKDIDIHFKTDEQFVAFKKALRARSFSFYQRRKRLGFEYTRTCWTLNLKLMLSICGVAGSVSFGLLKKQLKGIKPIVPGSNFSIDVVIDNENVPPFSDSLDFACNGLIMDANGIQLCDQLSRERSSRGNFRVLHSIMDDIVKKHAYAMKFTFHRWNKMDEKKTWQILGDQSFVNKISKKEDCIICHCEDAQYKLTCCNAMYHVNCLKRTLQNDHSRCAHCRREMHMGEEEMKFFVM